MVKDIINYEGKEYQLSTVYLDNMCIFETMIFSIKNGIIDHNEVYCFRTTQPGESLRKHEDTYFHPEKYLSDEAINEYFLSKGCFKRKNIEFPMRYLEKYMLGELTLDEAVNNTIEEIYRLIKEYVNNE